MIHLATNKQELRNYIRNLKTKIPAETVLKQSKEITVLLEKHPLFIKAKTILLYYALPDEVQITPIIDKYSRIKQIILPVVKQNDLELHYYLGENSLKKGAFNIMEPETPQFFDWEKIDLAIIPGMAFDSNGNRLGRGKGYYDRLLQNMPPKVYKIGICFNFQYFPSIPTTPLDIKMDEVLISPKLM